MLTYEEGVESFRVTDRLSDSERDVLMGGTLQQVYKLALAAILRVCPMGVGDRSVRHALKIAGGNVQSVPCIRRQQSLHARDIKVRHWPIPHRWEIGDAG